MASIVRSVLISIELDFLGLGVRGGEAGDDEGVAVSTDDFREPCKCK